MSHRTVWSDDGCIVHISDKLIYKEVEEINRELCSNYNFDNIKYFLRDLTAVKSVEISKDELEYAAYINFAASSYKQKLKDAFVINHKKIEENVNFYIETCKSIGISWDQRIFPDAVQALAWVKE